MPNYAVINPIYASLLAGFVMAGFPSLPALLIKPLEKTDENFTVGIADIIDSPRPDSTSADDATQTDLAGAKDNKLSGI